MKRILIVVGCNARIIHGFEHEFEADYKLGVTSGNLVQPTGYDKVLTTTNADDIVDAARNLLRDGPCLVNILWASALKDSALLIQEPTPDLRRIVDINIVYLYESLRGIISASIPKHAVSAVFLSTFRVRSPSPGTAIYSASKSFGEVLFKALAIEYGRFPFRFNSVRLGLVSGGMGDDLPESVSDDLLRRTPGRKRVEIESVWGILRTTFDNPGLNGATVDLDGGLQ